jgi:hypothetical protein
MPPLDRSVLSIPREQLAEALQQRLAKKREILAERDRRCGKDRVMIGSYMENIGWPELLGFDYRRRLADPDLHFDLSLREKIFWLDNSLDDGTAALAVEATQGMYFDMTLFGLEVTHTSQGVPAYGVHPLASRPDLSVFQPHDFRTTGAMPALLRQHQRLLELARAAKPELQVWFPSFHRGPLDLYIQMRTYEGFVEDTVERPEFLQQVFGYFVEERARWNRERAAYLGEPRPATTFMADDWVYVPFITPAMFQNFVLPAYRHSQELEGALTGFHTCGNLAPFVGDLLRTFPGIRNLDVSGWNDIELLHAKVPRDISFSVSFINTFVLSASEAEHRRLLGTVASIARERALTVCAQAMVRLHETYDEDLTRMNRFIELARQLLAR